MKTDAAIEKNVKEELKWDAGVKKDSDIKIAVNDGRVSLSGTIDSFPEKICAENAAMRVTGVRAVDNKLEVKIPSHLKKSDEEIEKAVLTAIKWNSSIDENKIRLTVEDGWVTLEGDVEWEYQRSKARILAQDIMGVSGVTNLINVRSFASSFEVKEKIAAAIQRQSVLNNSRISVEVDGGKALLTGQVRTLSEKNAAETAAWSAPGITNVVNELVVDYSEVFA